MIDDEKSEKQEVMKAVALQYKEDENSAPKIVAKGKGKVAENILLTAQNNAVPVYKNKTLTAMLMALEIDKEIPPALYSMVAEVLAYVYRMDQKKMKDFKL